ncbi:hypothetical protein AEM51_00635 [Bacteroidetes bacterium UKL13-3]|nr:hypothetical protein AEM51_00635 [Bacteroidetes bacterium UKL13-3]HCP93493.1 hypothetical protein [Bacteroidota bacterium]
MSINKNNYERFLLDYLDGKLDANEVSEVLLFLEQHPDIKAQFEGIAEVQLNDSIANTVSFAYLKKPEFNDVKSQYADLLVAEFEGDLSIAEAALLAEGVILYPEIKRERKLFSQTQFVPDHTVIYPHKQSLKRGNVWVLYRNKIIRVAAMFLMVASLGWYFLIPQSSTQMPIATIQTQSTQQSQLLQIQSAQKQLHAAKVIQHVSSKKDKGEQKKEKQLVIEKNIHFGVINEVSTKEIRSAAVSIAAQTNQLLAWIPYTQPQQFTNEEPVFLNIRTLALNKLNKQTRQLEEKAVTALYAFNKAAGVTVEKNEMTGKVNKIEIAGLDFEWLHSK